MSCLDISCADVVEDSISEHVVQSLFPADFVCRLADHGCDLHFVVQPLNDIRVSLHVFAVADSFVDTFGEVYRVRALSAESVALISAGFNSVIRVVYPETYNILSGAHYWSPHRYIAFEKRGDRFRIRPCGSFHHLHFFFSDILDQIVHITVMYLQFAEWYYFFPV